MLDNYLLGVTVLVNSCQENVEPSENSSFCDTPSFIVSDSMAKFANQKLSQILQTLLNAPHILNDAFSNLYNVIK